MIFFLHVSISIISYCFRKFELYALQWMNKENLANYTLSAAPYGGPIGNCHMSLLFEIVLFGDLKRL